MGRATFLFRRGQLAEAEQFEPPAIRAIHASSGFGQIRVHGMTLGPTDR
jgi:hypothetical protein